MPKNLFQAMEAETVRRVNNMGFNLPSGPIVTPQSLGSIFDTGPSDKWDGKDDPWDWQEEGI